MIHEVFPQCKKNFVKKHLFVKIIFKPRGKINKLSSCGQRSGKTAKKAEKNGEFLKESLSFFGKL